METDFREWLQGGVRKEMAACVNASPDGKFRRGRPGAGPRGDFNLV